MLAHHPAFLRLFMDWMPQNPVENPYCVSESHGLLSPDSASGNEGGYPSLH